MKIKSIYKAIIFLSVATMVFMNGVFPDFVTRTEYTYLAISLALLCAISFALHIAKNKVPANTIILLVLGLLFVGIMLMIQWQVEI